MPIKWMNRDPEGKTKKKKKAKKSRGVDDFEPLDFGKEIGKNINLRNQTQKPVKLLNRIFTQLEASAAQMRFPIKVTDIHGEEIGKKYDFRWVKIFFMILKTSYELKTNNEFISQV